MKQLAFSIAVLVCSTQAGAQNLVPNGSFEEYTECPDSPGQIDLCTGWMKFRWTPDYFNECNTNDYCDVPANAFGYQGAATGSAYAGVLTYLEGSPDEREYMGVQLTEDLIPGIPVHISLKVSPGGWSWYPVGFRYTTEGIGIFFTTTPWSGISGIVPNFSPVYLTAALTDTLNWVDIAGSYIPDSAYRYVVIGNFFRDTLIHPQLQDPGSNYAAAYVFVDDICVSSSNSECLIPAGISSEVEPRLRISPNPFTSEFYLDYTTESTPPVSVGLYDSMGRMKWNGMLESGRRRRVEADPSWPTGVYFLRILGSKITTGPIRVVHFQQ